MYISKSERNEDLFQIKQLRRELLSDKDPAKEAKLAALLQKSQAFEESRKKWISSGHSARVHAVDCEGFVWRGPRPPDVLWLQEQGFHAVIVLQSGLFEIFNEDAYEVGHPNEIGIQEYTIKCSTLTCPTRAQRKEFLRLIKELREQKLKIYFHCKSGVDRTGVMAATYRMQFSNWTGEGAYLEWVQKGRHWWYDWWKYSLKKWDK